MTSNATQKTPPGYCYTRPVVGSAVPRPYPNPAFEWASNYTNRGVAVVPVSFRSKRPCIADWPKLEITIENLGQHFRSHQQNVGVVLGGRSGWLVDVDLDSAEAIKLADYFLPPSTAVFGRKEKPSSHRLYLCKEAEYRKFNDPLMVASSDEDDRKNACIVEIRAGRGKQTVFPPSVHESGELIEWISDGEPRKIQATDLKTAVALLAGASLILKYWRMGVRHELSLALAGTVLLHGWSKDKARSLIRAICEVAHDEELHDRLKCVDDTAEALSRGKRTFGLPKLAELNRSKNRRCDLRMARDSKRPKAR